MGWDRTTTFVTEYQEALDGLEVDQVSDLVTSQYGIHIIKCTEVFTAPAELTSLDQLPADFQETFKSMAASTKASTAYQEWLEKLKESADIVINDMPSNASYNIDLTKYQQAAESASAASASAESASTESASAESASAESASAESASAEAVVQRAILLGAATKSQRLFFCSRNEKRPVSGRELSWRRGRDSRFPLRGNQRPRACALGPSA